MATLRRILCSVFRYCHNDYNKDNDPLFSRYWRVEARVTNLEKEWRPRDLVNL